MSTDPQMENTRAETFVLAGIIGFAAFLAFLFWFGSASSSTPSRPRPVPKWIGGLVNRPATYTLSSGEVLRVSVDDHGIVRYSMTDAQGRTLLKDPPPSASTYQRWHFFLDSQKRLWFHSADIGTFVWMPQTDGTYVMSDVVAGSALAQAMPGEFVSNMGSVAQRQFAPTK